MKQGIDNPFWPACVRLRSFREHVEAAAAGGFTSMVVSSDIVDDAARDGLDLMGMKRLAEASGIPIRHFDSLAAWAPIQLPEWASERMRARFDVPAEKALEICETLEVSNIVAVAGFAAGAVPGSELAEGFGRLCDRVSRMNIHVDLEFMPILGVPDLQAAWSIVRDAGRPNSGVMIDTWHFIKSGSRLSQLDEIPGAQLRSIQLSDGHLDQKGASLFADMILWREFPGEGVFPVHEILAAVAAREGLFHIAPEVFSWKTDDQSPREVGLRSRRALDATLEQARL